MIKERIETNNEKNLQNTLSLGEISFTLKYI